MTPLISVIIPTFQRAALLERHVAALSRQSLSPDDFEVIVVLDGDDPSTRPLIEAFRTPFSLRVLEQSRAGPGAARNRGAHEARASLLLFLDDDMEPLPELLHEHLRAHEQRCAAVTGTFAPPPRIRSNPFVRSVDQWWAEGLAKRRLPWHRFTYRDVWSGNLSISRSLFLDVGGFDERFFEMSAEDYELGYRLLQAGARILHAPRARCIHHEYPTVRRSLARARADGRGQVLLARTHPELAWDQQFAQEVHGALTVTLWKLMWTAPWLASLLAHTMELVLSLALGARLGVWRRMVSGLQAYWLWCGVRDELGTVEGAIALLRDAPIAPGGTEVDIDLAAGNDAIAASLDGALAAGARLWYGAHPIGWIAPAPGAEPLRPIHVRAEIAARFAWELLGAQALAGGGSLAPMLTPENPALRASAAGTDG